MKYRGKQKGISIASGSERVFINGRLTKSRSLPLAVLISASDTATAIDCSAATLSHRPKRPHLHLIRLLFIEAIFTQKIIGDIDSESRSGHGKDRLLISP
jgi:hypothetical protein